MYKNELLPVLQTRSLAKSKRNIFSENTAEYYLKNKEAIKRKVQKLMQKLV